MLQKQVFLQSEGDQWFNRNASHLNRDRIEFQMLAPFVKENSRVLEIGCSNGAACNFVVSNQSEYYGIDPSAKAIEAARLKHPGSKFIQGTADDLPFESDFFDVVYFGFCLYLVDRKLLTRVVAEADRVLRSPGFLAIFDFNVKYPYQRGYVHFDGMHSFKANYASLFLAFPQYSAAFSSVFSHGSNEPQFVEDVNERVSVDVLFKNHDG